MKKILSYVADDGTVFNDEEECLAYEFNSLNYSNIMLVGADGRIIPLTYETDLNKVSYIKVSTREDAETLQDIFNDKAIMPSPWDSLDIYPEPGEYFWEDDTWKWIEYREWLKDMEAQIEEKKKIFERVLGG